MVITYFVVIALLALSGIFSGLTLGLMGLNKFALARKVKLGNPYAKKIYPLRKDGNLLLATLLIGNVAVNSALAVFLGSITSGFIAGLTATALIVVFGEILPQAFFSKHALRFGSKFTWLVWMFLVVFYPITKPIAYTLDKVLGGELPTTMSKQEFHLFLEQQKETQAIDDDELQILKGGLVFSDKKVNEVMTPWQGAFYVHIHQKITRSLLVQVAKSGHSRIPVYDKAKNRVAGILYAKDLIDKDPLSGTNVKTIMRKDLFHISEHHRLDHVLNLFRERRTHLFIVKNRKKKITGILTLEDVLEEIVGDIVDEHDRHHKSRSTL